MKKIFSNRNFFLLFQGTLVSSIGNTFYNFAVGWYILDLTGPLAAGAYMATGGIIMLVLTPFCGVIADRFDKVKIVYLTDFLRGIAIIAAGSIIFLDLNLTQTLIILYASTVVLAVSGALFGPASNSLVPDILDEDLYQPANSAMSMIGSIQGIVGILLGGIMYTLLGIGWIFIINGVTFIFSGFSEMFIKSKFVEKGKLDFASGLKDMKEGLNYLVKKKGLMQMMYGSLMLNFAFIPVLANGFPYLFNKVLQVDPLQYSFVQISWSVGTLIGAIVIGSIAARLKVFKAAAIGLSFMLAGFSVMTYLIVMVLNGGMAYNAFLILIITVMGLQGLVNMYLNIPMNTAFMRSIDSEYRGRAFSVVGTMSQAAVPFALFLGGLIIETRGLVFLAYSSVAILVLVMIYMFSNRNVVGFLKGLDKV